jgi:hypothetical protein
MARETVFIELKRDQCQTHYLLVMRQVWHGEV